MIFFKRIESQRYNEIEDTDNKKSEKALDKYAVNLNEKAAEGKVDPLIGRQSEEQAAKICWFK